MSIGEYGQKKISKFALMSILIDFAGTAFASGNGCAYHFAR